MSAKKMTRQALERWIAEQMDLCAQCGAYRMHHGQSISYREPDEALLDWLRRRQAARVMGRAGGSARTERKAAAARQNGRRGGRPRKKQ